MYTVYCICILYAVYVYMYTVYCICICILYIIYTVYCICIRILYTVFVYVYILYTVYVYCILYNNVYCRCTSMYPGKCGLHHAYWLPYLSHVCTYINSLMYICVCVCVCLIWVMWLTNSEKICWYTSVCTSILQNWTFPPSPASSCIAISERHNSSHTVQHHGGRACLLYISLSNKKYRYTCTHL